MPLNKSTGNMYPWITHTWNTVKGECPHGCTYCYMHRWGKQKPVRFDEKEFKTDLGSGNFIFVGSSCDMFAGGIPHEWIQDTLYHCRKFDNQYLFQTKNTFRFEGNGLLFPDGSKFCTTIETNRIYPDIMGNCPKPSDRAYHLPSAGYVTIEPIMDFDLKDMVMLIGLCNPLQVNIGADSGNNNLPEPSKEKLLALIDELQKFTVIAKKTNLDRIMNN
jgi:hypothetical protein